MALNCCTRCRAYWTCVTKWYRGEKGEEDICCDVCEHYRACLKAELDDAMHPQNDDAQHPQGKDASA